MKTFLIERLDIATSVATSSRSAIMESSVHGGAWEVEHSRPRCEYGSEGLCNLYAAHISCNRSKQARSTRSARAQYGRTRAPLSVKRRAQVKVDNAVTEGLLGGLVGAAIGGRRGFVVGALVAGKNGYDRNPDY